MYSVLFDLNSNPSFMRSGCMIFNIMSLSDSDNKYEYGTYVFMDRTGV